MDGAGNRSQRKILIDFVMFMAKYSPQGHLMWLRKVLTDKDWVSPHWLGTNESGNILALVRLHYREYDPAGDEGGQNQDYALATFDPNGKLLGKKMLSHGARLTIEAVAKNGKGELYLVGNRWKLNAYGFPVEPDGGELIKCDSKGEFVWSRNIKIPDGCFAKGITWGDDGELYIFGDSHRYEHEPPPPRHARRPPTRFFIYRLAVGNPGGGR